MLPSRLMDQERGLTDAAVVSGGDHRRIWSLPGSEPCQEGANQWLLTNPFAARSASSKV